jgi:hypothetical protein
VESVDRKGGEGNTGKIRTRRTPSCESAFPRIESIRESARHDEKERFTTLLHIGTRFEQEYDARRFLTDLRGRLQKFALTLHPDKTPLIEFDRFAAANRPRRELGKSEKLDFLGFKYKCGRPLFAHFQFKRKSPRGRMRVRLKALSVTLRRRLHEPIQEQRQWMAQVVSGYFAYHARPTNFKILPAFRHYVQVFWRGALLRRIQRHSTTLERIGHLMANFLH